MHYHQGLLPKPSWNHLLVLLYCWYQASVVFSKRKGAKGDETFGPMSWLYGLGTIV
jgi:hypothetical protein